MKNEKKSINCENVRFRFFSEGVKRKSGSRKSTGSEFHTADERSRTLVVPVSLFRFVGRTVDGPTSRTSACRRDL